MAGETRERILEVAERLFATAGFASTSLRDITAEAGVNLAAVNYHFGSKEALLVAILERRIRPRKYRRRALLDELEARAYGGPTVEQIVAAFVSPPFQSALIEGSRRREMLKLVGQLHSQVNPEFRRLFIQQFDEVRIRFTASLQRVLPDIDPEEVARRVMYIVGAMIYMMSWGEESGHPPSQAPERLLQSLIEFASAGMAAPATAPAGIPAPETLPTDASVAAHGGHA
ncbi:MAG: TetR/AcrR family transcriptional regulator [Acidobacteria bacterium]|nr:TetR/AcrR family transcriptional regulator [Acidobacteriota bacterium]